MDSKFNDVQWLMKVLALQIYLKSFFVAVIMFIVFEKFQKKFIHVFSICNFVIKCFDLIKDVD